MGVAAGGGANMSLAFLVSCPSRPDVPPPPAKFFRWGGGGVGGCGWGGRGGGGREILGTRLLAVASCPDARLPGRADRP